MAGAAHAIASAGEPREPRAAQCRVYAAVGFFLSDLDLLLAVSLLLLPDEVLVELPLSAAAAFLYESLR